MKKPIFRLQYRPESLLFAPTVYQVVDAVSGELKPAVSLTVPNLTFTIEQLLVRARGGLPVPQGAVFDSDIDLSQFDKMDKFDKINMSRLYKNRADALRSELDKAKLADARAKHEAEMDARVKLAVDDALKSSRPPIS